LRATHTFLPISPAQYAQPDSLQRKPCAVRCYSPLPRDGIRQTECVHSRHKFNRSPDDYLRNEQNHQTGKVHVGNHEARYEPRFGERLYREYRGTLPHCKIYEPIEGIEYSTEYRAAVGSLQPQNYRRGNSKLEQRKVC
jgi:hypothetical protein